MNDTTQQTPPKRHRKIPHEPEQTGVDSAGIPPSDAPDKPQTKAALVIAMLAAPGGATLDELVAATSWLPHTTRAALTGLRKKGHTLTSEKVDGVRRYRIAAPAADADAAQ